MVMKEAPFAGGKTLRYSWDNMELLTDTLGLETLTDFANFFVSNRFGLKHIRIMVWAGLQREGAPYDLKDVGKLIDEYLDEHDMGELAETVINAINRSWGEDKGEEKGETPKKTPRLSKNSST
jgi:hypothetical protein